jgi:hypothetical protein
MSNEENESINHYLEINPLTKMLLAVLGTMLTGLAVSTWNLVQSSNVEIIKLQSSIQSIRVDVDNGRDSFLKNNEALEKRIEKLENAK